VLVLASWAVLLVVPAAAAQGAPDVEVSGLSWTRDVNRGLRLKAYHAHSPAPSPDFVQEVSAVFRNVGAKDVKSVTWEYVVYEDSDAARGARVYKFRSKAPLRPGASARLSKQGLDIWHGRRVEARVTRVEYADGTVWQRVKG
jgi:hypothetical protein